MTGPNYLKTYLKKIMQDESLDIFLPEILNAFSVLKLKKRHFFVEQGAVCPYFCFIESGLLQHSITISGEEKTTYIALKSSCTSALKSFLQKSPARKSIKALSDCLLWVVDYNTFHHLIKNNNAFYRFYYNLIENQIFLIDDYRIDLLTLTPGERYRKMLANEPDLLLKVPLHYLASFLGISTRHMSRIRKNIK